MTYNETVRMKMKPIPKDDDETKGKKIKKK